MLQNSVVLTQISFVSHAKSYFMSSVDKYLIFVVEKWSGVVVASIKKVRAINDFNGRLLRRIWAEKMKKAA